MKRRQLLQILLLFIINPLSIYNLFRKKEIRYYSIGYKAKITDGIADSAQLVYKPINDACTIKQIRYLKGFNVIDVRVLDNDKFMEMINKQDLVHLSKNISKPYKL